VPAREWLPPILTGAGIAVIGWLIRNAVSGIVDRINHLEASFTRVTGELAARHNYIEKRIDHIDRRVTRVESWKELVTLPPPMGGRRYTDVDKDD
jgi:hypothetical protein